jgi:hypothetical protein
MKLGFATDRVASTILKFERAKTTGYPPAMTLTYAPESHSDLKLRIATFFDSPPGELGRTPVLLGCTALCLLLALNFMEIHRGVKTFLRWIN